MNSNNLVPSATYSPFRKTYINSSFNCSDASPVSDGGVPGPTVVEAVAGVDALCEIVEERSPVGPLVDVDLKDKEQIFWTLQSTNFAEKIAIQWSRNIYFLSLEAWLSLYEHQKLEKRRDESPVMCYSPPQIPDCRSRSMFLCDQARR